MAGGMYKFFSSTWNASVNAGGTRTELVCAVISVVTAFFGYLSSSKGASLLWLLLLLLEPLLSFPFVGRWGLLGLVILRTVRNLGSGISKCLVMGDKVKWRCLYFDNNCRYLYCVDAAPRLVLVFQNLKRSQREALHRERKRA